MKCRSWPLVFNEDFSSLNWFPRGALPFCILGNKISQRFPLIAGLKANRGEFGIYKMIGKKKFCHFQFRIATGHSACLLFTIMELCLVLVFVKILSSQGVWVNQGEEIESPLQLIRQGKLSMGASYAHLQFPIQVSRVEKAFDDLEGRCASL